MSLIAIKNDYDNCISQIINSVENGSYSGFSSERFSIKTANSISFLAEPLALKHIKPQSQYSKIEIIIDFLCEFDNCRVNDYFNQLVSSNTKVTIRGLNENKNIGYFGFHFDAHKLKQHEEEEEKESQLHPRFHSQFLQNPNSLEDFDYGDTLQLDIPRFTHFPMDLVLSLGFVLANFCPQAYEELTNNTDFLRIHKRYEERYWKPYVKSLNDLFSENLQEVKTAHPLHPYAILI